MGNLALALKSTAISKTGVRQGVGRRGGQTESRRKGEREPVPHSSDFAKSGLRLGAESQGLGQN